MKRYRIMSIAVIVAAFGLSACALKKDMSQDMKKEPPSAGDVVGLKLFVDGEALAKLVSNPKRADEALTKMVGKRFDGNRGRDELRTALRKINRGEIPDVDVPAFNGLGGYSAGQLASAVLDPNEIRETRGLIGDFLFDEQQLSGHLTVDTRTKIFYSAVNQANDSPDRVEILQWHIEVRPGTFSVHPRQDDRPWDPFPGTIQLPEEALDPNNPNGIWVRDLNHKLFARGRQIRVKDVYLQVDGGPIVRLPNGHPYYRSTDDSCIDLLTKGPPPALRIDFPEQSGYCLGRCDHPPVINSM